jgi:hypothetical protein
MVAAPEAAYRELRRTIAANKDRPTSVEDFTEKAWAALHQEIHLLVIDLFPPGRYDPGGMHAMIWRRYDPVDYESPAGKPLTAAAYCAASLPEAYVEPLAVGDSLPEMPLFFQPDRYVNVPLDEAYAEGFRGVPAYWRGVIEGKA